MDDGGQHAHSRPDRPLNAAAPTSSANRRRRSSGGRLGRRSLQTLIRTGAVVGGLVVVAPAVADSAPEPAARLIRAEFLAAAPPPPAPVAVCVVDSGVTPTPDLPVGTTLIESTSLDGGSGDDVHPYRHGTTVAEIIAGQDNGWGQTGVWPQAKIVSVRAFAPNGLPSYGHYARAIRRCLEYRATRSARVRVINLSLGQLSGSDDERLLLAEQIAAAHERDVSVVAAAGNRGRIDFPASEPGVLAVTAADRTGGTCSFSAAGSGTVAAAGCRVLSATADGTPTAVTGTSFAAPAVSAVLAALRAYRPDWPRERAERAVRTATTSEGSGQATLLDAEALFGAADLPSMSRAPTLIRAPSITGSAPSPGALLTCLAGIWNADRSRDYSWQRGDRTVAAGAQYVVTDADRGTSLACAEVAHNRAGSTVATSPRVLVPVTGEPRVVEAQPVVSREVPVPRRVTVRAARGGVVVVRFSRSNARHVVEAVLGKLRARGRGPELRLRRAVNAHVVRVWSIDRRTGRRSAPITVALPPADGVLRAQTRWRNFP